MRAIINKEQGVEQEAAAKERFWADMGEVYRIYEEGMRGHYRFYSVLDSINLACTRENGSLGMQCDKIADFSEGTDAKSANLPKNPQSLHSHTANTNFFACSSNPTESTLSEAKPSVEIQENTESKESLDSSLSSSDSESTTSKNPSEALPNINNSACVSTSLAESMGIDSAIFAEQKSNKMCSASAHTDTRPLRGVQSLEQGGSSASATIALEADKRGSPLDCRAKGLQAKRSKNSGGFFGALRVRGGDKPLFAKKQNDFENLGSIRENTTLRNLESTESKADSESKAENLGNTESSPTDSKTRTESKEILKNGQGQNLSPKESTESKVDSESRFKVLELDSESSSTESNTDSKTSTQSKAETLNNEQTPNHTELLTSLCAKLGIAPTREHFVALIERIVNLREDAILKLLKSKSPTEIAHARALLLEYVSAYYAAAHAKLLHAIESRQLLTPFYREILASTYRIGLCMNAFFALWDRELIQGINARLGEIFSFEEALALLEPTMERDSAGNNAQRTYSLPCHPRTPLTRQSAFSCVPYIEAFPKEVGAIIEAIEVSVGRLEGLEDSVFGCAQAYVEYFKALKNAWACTNSAQLIESWRAVDYAWMRIDAPLQVGHPLEYYEDVYRHAVAPEWDLRLCVAKDNKGIYALDVAQGIKHAFSLLADTLGYGARSRAFVKHSLEKSRVYESVPLLFFGAENNGLFSAQVVPNDEIVSRKEGKKIFAFPLRIIAQVRAKPQMRLSYEFFSKEFIARGREVLFHNESLWHSVYDLSTNGHEFGHILWIDESSEEAMNKSGEFKNIEEFKATSGGIVAYLLAHSPIARILCDGLGDLERLSVEHCLRALESCSAVEAEIWEALFDDCLRRAVGLMAWRESLEVRPYYCEGIIHLCGGFESGALEFDKSREFGKVGINRARYVELALWYLRTYVDLAAHYRDKKDAKAWLERFCINKQSKGVRVLHPQASALVEHYFERYVAIGEEIYEE
ncbi:invasion protein CiaB [uncultured Helicobacter sp.]|uniref:invasion protein CiaB n=1 Tax=uncultured Helicobacter sp. TaxID=175537 RepID=UPI003752DE7C